MHAAGGLSERGSILCVGGGGHVGQVTSHVRGSGPLVSHKLARAGLWLSLLGLLAKTNRCGFFFFIVAIAVVSVRLC